MTALLYAIMLESQSDNFTIIRDYFNDYFTDYIAIISRLLRLFYRLYALFHGISTPKMVMCQCRQ
jgi:hypothetical protein